MLTGNQVLTGHQLLTGNPVLVGQQVLTGQRVLAEYQAPPEHQAPPARPASATPPGGWFEPGRAAQRASGGWDRRQAGDYYGTVPGDPRQQHPGQRPPFGRDPWQRGTAQRFETGPQPAVPASQGPAPGSAAQTRPARSPDPRAGWEAAGSAPIAVQPEQLSQLGHQDLMRSPAANAWPDISDQFGLHLLVLAEQLRTSLDELEADEGDPERLQRLYQVDHAVTRMRRACRDLRTLAGRSEEELAGFTTSLLDVIRMAASAIERYTQVSIGRVTDLAVLGYAADDVGSLLAALLDNATRYSPGAVSVSGHLLQDGGVMFRVEDTGIGIGPDQVAGLNDALAGPVPEVDQRTGRHTGFAVVHRIARKHSIGVRLASRPLPSSGTVAMVTLPPHLLCEVPVELVQHRPAAVNEAAQAAATATRGAAVSDMPRRVRAPAQATTGVQAWAIGEDPRWASAGELRDLAEPEPLRLADNLPKRERASLRGDEPRPRDTTERSPEEQSAARRAFADELNAFAAGISNTAIEENNHA